MKRTSTLTLFLFLSLVLLFSSNNSSEAKSDREYTADLAYKIAEPVLRNMAN